MGVVTFNADGTFIATITENGNPDLHQVSSSYQTEPGGSLSFFLDLPNEGFTSTLRLVTAHNGQEGFLIQTSPGQMMTGSAKLQ